VRRPQKNGHEAFNGKLDSPEHRIGLTPISVVMSAPAGAA